MIERGRERPEAVGRDAAERGLEAGHTAGRRRQADGRAGVGGEPECAQPGRERARVATRRTARNAIGPRAVDDGAIGAVARRHAPGELVQVGLAEHDRPGVHEPPDARRRMHGHVVAEDARAVGRAHARGVEDVLDQQRHARQRPERHVPRMRERALGRERDDGVQVLVRGDAVEVMARHLLGGELAGAHGVGDATGGPGMHLRSARGVALALSPRLRE